jgi:integrase
MPGRIVHDFRRTACRNLERQGISRSAAMKMVGHKTEAIYRRYAIADELVLKEAAAKSMRHTCPLMPAKIGQDSVKMNDLNLENQ